MCNNVYYLTYEVCFIIICEGVLRVCFVARCLCSYITSRPVTRGHDRQLWYLRKCWLANQSDFSLQRRVMLNSLS